MEHKIVGSEGAFCQAPCRRIFCDGGRYRLAALVGLCCGLALGGHYPATARDVREEVAAASKRHLAKMDQMPPKHHWVHPAAANTRTVSQPVPGGTGFGDYFVNIALRWTNSTAIDYYIVAPSTLGGISTNYLYLTTTCRSLLGTEALVSYYLENEAQFSVFDWALASSNPWQVIINLPSEHPQYLTQRYDEFGTKRQMCHARNGTYYLGFSANSYRWRNQVLLYNYALGEWDIIYSYDYGTTSLASNLFQGSASGGWWGPIVETFGNYDRTHAVGFDLVRLFQDGQTNSFWLAPNNCTLQMGVFKSITVAPYRSYTVFSGSTSPDTNAFRIKSFSLAGSAREASIEVDTLPARQFQAYASVEAGGFSEWIAAGPPSTGTGAPITLQVPAPFKTALYKVGAIARTGSLLVVVDRPDVSFDLEPNAGLLASAWISEPLTNRWDKVVIGITPGDYTLTFSGPADFSAPPPQMLTITNFGISTVYGIFGTPNASPAN